MDRIYHYNDTMYVAATKIYVKSGDTYAYADSAKNEKIKAEVLQDLFHEGLIIVDGTTEYTPVSFDLTEGVASLTYIKATKASGSTLTATPTVIYSEEYTAEAA
jgi:hypothetical protein